MLALDPELMFRDLPKCPDDSAPPPSWTTCYRLSLGLLLHRLLTGSPQTYFRPLQPILPDSAQVLFPKCESAHITPSLCLRSFNTSKSLDKTQNRWWGSRDLPCCVISSTLPQLWVLSFRTSVPSQKLSPHRALHSHSSASPSSATSSRCLPRPPRHRAQSTRHLPPLVTSQLSLNS